MTVVSDLTAISDAVDALIVSVGDAQSRNTPINDDLEVTDALSNAGLTAQSLRAVLDGEVGTRAVNQNTAQSL